MGISLSKKQTISLDKEAGSPLKNITMGLGWDPVKSGGGFMSKLLGSGGGGSIDLDASCILMARDKSAIDMVWFRQLRSKDGSIQHTGDNLTGEGDGDDESIKVNLDRLPSEVEYLVFTVNSFTGQNFNQVENAYCRIVDESSKRELAKFDLSEKGGHTGIIMAVLTRMGSGWDITAIGRATNGKTVKDLSREAASLVGA
jgi:tellurium resistance protein TerZ